jgi:hypothetical protein
MSEQLLTAINDTFDPWRPLPAGDPLYVDCENVRGDANIIRSLGNSITRSTRDKCHLYAGHRGNGKSTELLRLKQHLEDNGCFVVYFDAGPSMNTIDIEYTDILLSCTEHLTLAIRDAYSQPILDWLKARWNSIKDFLDTEVEIESLKIEQQIEQIGKVTSSLKFNPSYRAQIREKIEPHTISLRDALNEFIRDAKKKLPDDKQKLIISIGSYQSRRVMVRQIMMKYLSIEPLNFAV